MEGLLFGDIFEIEFEIALTQTVAFSDAIKVEGRLVLLVEDGLSHQKDELQSHIQLSHQFLPQMIQVDVVADFLRHARVRQKVGLDYAVGGQVIEAVFDA